MNTNVKLPAVFLDRDGTINVEKDYLHKIEDFEFVPGVPEAIRRLKNAGYLVIVVTNQSGVARGYYSLDDVLLLHAQIQKLLAEYKTAIDTFYICPHHLDEGIGEFRKKCDCRKGAPGMLLEAAAAYDIDLERSYMVGDKLADIQAGEAAGCRTILVETGYGKNTAANLLSGRTQLCKDLSDAVDFILSRHSFQSS